MKPRVYLFATYFRESKDQTPESEQAAVDRLASVGPRIIGPLIAAIRNESPWSKRTVLFPFVLGKFKEPARRQLLAAIDDESDPSRKTHLIYALQSGFDDFSRFPDYLDAVESSSRGLADSRMRSQLFEFMFLHEKELALDRLIKIDREGTAIPDIVIGGSGESASSRINPHFIRWYRIASKPKGPLPIWESKRQFSDVSPTKVN